MSEVATGVIDTIGRIRGSSVNNVYLTFEGLGAPRIWDWSSTW